VYGNGRPSFGFQYRVLGTGDWKVARTGRLESLPYIICASRYAENPFPHLEEQTKKQMTAAHSALVQKFSDLAFDEAADVRWRESRPTEADNIDVGPVTEAGLQGDLLEPSGNPF